MIKTIWDKSGFKQLLTKKNAKFIFISWLLSVLCYLPMIANGVTNSADGLWQPTFFQAGNWEISLGRWAWPVLDKLRMGYAADPFNSFLTLLLITTAAWLAIQMFTDLTQKHYIYVLLITVSTTTCCFLSYRYMSPTFGMATILPIIAIYLISNKSFTGKETWIINSIIVLLIVLTLALYQANLGIFCVLVVFLFMKYILDDDINYGFRFIARAILLGLTSCVVYKILWEVCLKLRHTEVSNYNGANSSFSTIIQNIPFGVIHAYNNWASRRLLVDGNYIFKPIRLIIYSFIFFLFLYTGLTKQRITIENRLCYYISLLLIPVAANICFLLAPSVEFIQMQMTAPLVFSGLIALCFVDLHAPTNLKKALVLCVAVLLYGNIYCVGTDEEAMIQGNRTMESIMNKVIASIQMEDGLSSDKTYIFVGDISDNVLFKTNELWDKASPYAHVGDMWPDVNLTIANYKGLLDHIGIKLSLANVETYQKYINSKQLKAMPSYPEKGSIVVNDNEVIIKISDYYFVESEGN